MPLIWALFLGAAPHKHRLADAAERYLAGDVTAVRVFEELHAERPHDDLVAWWLAAVPGNAHQAILTAVRRKQTAWAVARSSSILRRLASVI